MKKFKLNIDALDLANMCGKSVRHGYRLLNLIRKLRKKKKNDLITTVDVAIALNCNKEQLDKYFYGE